MNAFVLDCSVSASWFLKDETNPSADRILTLLKDRRALVPALWPAEMANVFLTAERRKRIQAAAVARAMELLAGMPIDVDAWSTGAVVDLQRIGRMFDLSAYDAAYLELAQRSGLALATLDGRLRVAARDSGVELV